MIDDRTEGHWSYDECLKKCNCKYESHKIVDDITKPHFFYYCFLEITGNKPPLATLESCKKKCECYDDYKSVRFFKLKIMSNPFNLEKCTSLENEVLY